MSDFTIDIELSLSKSEREAMAVLDRLEKQIERLNKSIKIVTNLDTSGVDAQVKVIQQKFTAGKVAVGLPDDRAIAAFNAKIGTSKISGGSTSSGSTQAFPKTFELGNSTILLLKESILKAANTQEKASATNATTIVNGLKKGLVSTIVGNAGGIVAAAVAQKAITSGAAQKVASSAAGSISPELTQRASAALKELTDNDPLLNKVKNSFDNLVLSIRSVDGVEESIQGLSKAFKAIQPSIDSAMAGLAEFSDRLKNSERLQALYATALERTKSTIAASITVYGELVSRIKELDERFNLSAKALDLTDAAISAIAGSLRDLDNQFNISINFTKAFGSQLESLQKYLSESGAVTAFLEERLKGFSEILGQLKESGNFSKALIDGLDLLKQDLPAAIAGFQLLADQSDRYVAQLKEVRKASKEFRESLGEVADKYSALSGIISAISSPLKVFEIELGGITKYLRQFTNGIDSVVFGLQEFERLSDIASAKLKTIDNQPGKLALVIDDSIRELPALLARIQAGLDLSGVVRLDASQLQDVATQVKAIEILFRFLIEEHKIQFTSNLNTVEAEFVAVQGEIKSTTKLLTGVQDQLKLVGTPTPIRFGLDDIAGAASLIGKLKAAIEQLSVKSSIEVSYGQLVEADAVAERLSKSLAGAQQKLISAGTNSPTLSIDDKSLGGLESRLSELSGRTIAIAIEVTEASLKSATDRVDLLKSDFKTIDITPVIAIEEPIKKAESLFGKFKKSISDIASKLSIDSDSLKPAKEKFEEFKAGIATVKSVMTMETPWVEAVNEHVFELKKSIEVVHGKINIDDISLKSALDSAKALQAVKSFEISAPSIALLSTQLGEVKALLAGIAKPVDLLVSSASIKSQIEDLKSLESQLKALKKSGGDLKLAPAVDQSSLKKDLANYEGKTIEVRAIPVFEDVYTAYAALDEKIVNGRFRVEAIPEFETAFAQLKQLDTAIDGIKKESKLVLTADGLEGSVKAFQAVEEAIKGVVSAMDNAARLSNQSLSTLKAAVEATPAGGDLRTKAPFVAQSLIEQEKLAEQSLKRLKALAADLKIEPLGNKSTKAAYITAIEEFITAGGKIGDAWKRTENTFEGVAKKMKKVAGETGESMVDDMNHSAADTVAAAWRRTEGVFEGVTKSMVAIAEKTGAELVAAFKYSFAQIESLSKNIDIKINTSSLEKIEKVDSKKIQITASDVAFLSSSMISLATATDNAGRAGAVLSMIGTLAGKIDSSHVTEFRKQLGLMVSEGANINGLVVGFNKIKESAETVTAAWKRTNIAFHAEAESMEVQAKATGAVLVDNLNHRAADTVAAAWERTRKSVSKVYEELSTKAKVAGGEISENLTKSLSNAFDGFKKSAGEAATVIKGRLSIAIQSITTEFKSLGTTLKGKLSSAFEELSNRAEKAGKDVRDVAGQVKSQAGKQGINFDVNSEAVNKKIGSVRDTLSSVASGFSLGNIKAQIDSIGSSIENVTKVSNVIGYLKNAAAEKVEALPWLGPMATKAGELAIKFGVAKVTVGAFTLVVGGMVAAVVAATAAVAALVGAAIAINAAWRGMTDQLIGGGKAIYDAWFNVSQQIVEVAGRVVDAWKTASSAIISTGQSIITTWQSVTSAIISGGKQLFDTWKGATDAVTGFAATSVKAYADVETSIKAVSGILDLSTKQSEDLFNSVQKTGQDASNKFSTKQISALAATLAKGGKQVDEIKSLLAPISTGATAIGEEDLAKFGGNFLDVIGKFNIPLKDANKAVELYVKTLTSAKVDASAFANTIKYANVEKEGVEGLKDLAAQTVAFAQVGTRGSKVGTDVNRVMTELAIALEGTSKKAERQRDILKELGLAEEFAGDKAKDVVNRLPALAKAFNDLEKETGRDNAIAKFNELLGTKGTQAILSFSKVSAEKFKQVRADLDKVAQGTSGVVKKFASLAVAGVSGAIVTLENNLETVQAALGKSLSKTVAGFATIATSILSTIGGPTSPVFKALTAVGEKVEKLFSVGGKGEELAAKIGKAFEGLATKGVSVFADTIGNVVEYFSDTKNINEFTKRVEYLGYVFVEVYKIATQLIGGFAAVAFQIVGAVQAFSQSSSGQALGAGMNTAFTAIATGGASLLDDKLKSIQNYFSDQTNVKNFTNALQFVGKAALIAYSSLTDMLATMYRMSVAAIGIVDIFSKTDVGANFFKTLMAGFKDLSEQSIALTTKRLQEFSDHLQKGDNAAQFAAQLKSIGELSLFAYDGLTQAVAGLANIGLQAAKTTNDFIKSQEGVALIDRLSATFKKVGGEANNLIQKGLGQVFEYLSRPEVSAAIENIALGFLKLYDGLTRIVGIGFDGLLKLGSALGAFFSSPKGQSTIDKLVEGFAKLMDVGIGFLLEQLDKFTAWANEPGNLGELVDLLKSAAELWLQNYIGLTKFNLEMAAFSINVTKGLGAFAKALEFKNTPLLDTSGTLAAIDEMTNKLAGFRLYSEEQKRMDKERSASSGNFFAGATEAFMTTIAPAMINIKAAVDDFMKNGAPALGQIFATIGVTLGIIVQVLGNGIALVIRLVTAALPIINVILQPILGFINLIYGSIATVISVVTSGVGAAAGILNTFLSGTLDPIAKFIGGLFNGGIKNMGLFSTVVAQGFAVLEKIIAPVVEFIANSFYKLPENLFKIFGAITDIVQANWGAITKATSDTVRGIGDGFNGVGKSISGAFEGGKSAATGFGESLKSGVIAKIEETKQYGADIGQGMAISWGEATKSMRSNYDDFALNFGVTSQQTDQFFTDMRDGIVAGWNVAVDAVTTKWNDYGVFFAGIATAIGTTWNEVTGSLVAVWNAAADIMGAKWNEFAGFVASIWAATMSVLQPYLDALVAGFNTAVGAMSAAWNSFTGYLSSAWNGVVNAIVSGFQAAMNAVGGIAQNTGTALIGFFTQAANAIGSVFAQIGQGIAAFFQPAVDAVNNIVEKLSQARSFGDGVGKVLSGQVFQGARAAGGPVTGGAGAYLVGERGPEIFVPKTDGYIVPNHAIDGFRAEGGPVTAGKTYVVGEIGTEAFIPGSGKKSASFSIDFTSAITPLLTQATRSGNHLNTIALGIKNIQNNAYAIAFQIKPILAEIKNAVMAIGKIQVGGGGGFNLPAFNGFGGFNLPGANTAPTGTGSSITAAFKAKDKAAIEAGLVAAAQKAGITDKAQLAYLLATAKHESDNFATLTEYASGSAYEGRSDLGNTQSGDGVRFKGRGFVQLTGRANYEKYSKKLGIDLIKNPELAADPEIAARILADGMLTGAYTGAKLNDYGKGSSFNAVGARAIVNGSDRAGLIAGYSGDYSGKIDGIVQKANAIVKGDGGTLNRLPGSFGTATGSTKVAGKLPTLSVSSLGVGSAQEYGASRDGGARRHAGQDIDVFYTDPAEGKMYSMLGGIVVKNWEDPRDYFNYTDIYNPGQNLIERIAERGPALVREGQTVKPGDVVSKGVAGQASAIHYEIRKVQKDASSKYGVSAVSPGLGVVEGTYDPIKKLEELGLGRRSGSDFIGSGQVLSSNGGGGQSSGGGSFSLPGASILTYEQFAAQKGDGGPLTKLPGSISAGAAQAAAPIVNLPTFTLPKTVSGKGGTKEVAAKIDPQKLKVALKSNDIENLAKIYDKARGQATITAKLLPKTIQDIYGLSGTEEVRRDQVGSLLINLRRLVGATTTGTAFNPGQASLGITSAEFKKTADLATEASAKGVEIPVELLGADFKKAIGKTTGSVKAVELLKVLSELKTADPTKYSSVSTEAIDRIAYIASLNDGERKTLDELVARLERDKRDRVVASELPDAVRKLLGVKSGEESVAVDRIKTLIKEIGELPISLPADLETALASLSERELKNAIETIKDAQRAGDKAIFASSLTPELRKGLNLKPADKIDINKLGELLPVLEGRLSKIAGGKELGRLEQILKFNKINLSSSALDALEKQFSKVIEAQKFDLKSLGQDEVNALEKLGVLRSGALGVGESYIDEAKLQKLYGNGATIADAVNGTVKAVGDANAAIVKAQEASSSAVATSTDKLPPVPVIPGLQNSVITETQKSATQAAVTTSTLSPAILDSLDFADLSTSALKSSAKPQPKSISDRIREIAIKTGQDAFAIQAELQRQGLKAIGAVGGTGVLPTITEIQSALKTSASFTQASQSTDLNDRIREIIERTGLDAFKIQDELQKAGLKAIGAVGGKGTLPTITEIRKILDTGLQKPVIQAAVSAGLPVANTVKPTSSTGKPLVQSSPSIIGSAISAVAPVSAPKTKSNPILEAAKKVGSDAFAIQKELEKQGLKAIGAVGGKGVLPTINEIQAALKNSAGAVEATKPGSTLADRIQEIAKRTNGDAFAIQKELEKGRLRAIGAVGGTGTLPTIAEIQKIVKAGNTEISKSVTASLPATPLISTSVTDSIAAALGVDAKIFTETDLKDPFAIQKALEKAGYKSIGGLGADGKTVKSGAANELPTIDRIRKAVDGAMDANKGIVSAIASSTTATLDVVQAQTSDIESQIAKLYGVDATGLTGLSGFALATEIQKRVQAKGGRAVGGLNSTKANELPTISEINSKLVDLSKAIDTKQQSATSPAAGTAGASGAIVSSSPTPAQKKFEFKFGGTGDTASREEVEGKLKQFEQYLNSDEFLAVAVEMVLSALKNDSRARLFGGLL